MGNIQERTSVDWDSQHPSDERKSDTSRDYPDATAAEAPADGARSYQDTDAAEAMSDASRDHEDADSAEAMSDDSRDQDDSAEAEAMSDDSRDQEDSDEADAMSDESYQFEGSESDESDDEGSEDIGAESASAGLHAVADGWSGYDSDGSLDYDGDEASHGRIRRDWAHVRDFDDVKAAKRACEAWEGYVYTQESSYETTWRHSWTFVCRSHAGCEHRIKIAATNYHTPRGRLSMIEGEDTGTGKFAVLASGSHGAVDFPMTRRGIHPAMRVQAEAMLQMGWSPMRIRDMLELKYASDPQMLASLPSFRQLQNRKAYMAKRLIPWNLTNFAGFYAFASEQLCDTRETFFAVEDESDPRMDDLIFLDAFLTDEDSSDPSCGAILTSRRLFRNVHRAVRDQAGELSCATDGTYKLHFGGWVLVDCGTEAVTYARGDFVHRFIPWVYMFVRSETIDGYRRMFQSVRRFASLFFDVQVDVVYGSLDHSEAIGSAFLAEWPRIKLLTCWPHLLRNVKKHTRLLSDKAVYDDMIKGHLNLLREARTHAQFLRMSQIITEHWFEEGERDFTNWFRSVYLSRHWDRWHVNGAGIGGVIPSQQGIEAHHGAIKRTCATSSRASTSAVLSQLMPRILRFGRDQLCPTTCAHFCDGPIPPEMMEKAGHLSRTADNHWRVFKGRGRSRRIAEVVFNAKAQVVSPSNALGQAVTKDRVKRFAASLAGQVANGISASEIKFELLSLHLVTIAARGLPTTPYQHAAVWSTDDITRIRRTMKCTCTSYIVTGWLCAHVLATLSLLELLNVQAALSSIPIRRAPGRPRGRGPALERDGEGDRYYAEAALIRRFTNRPLFPMGWRIIDDFQLVVDGRETTSTFVGTIIGTRVDTEEGVLMYTARFDEGELRDFDVSELATAVRRAYLGGIQVQP